MSLDISNDQENKINDILDRGIKEIEKAEELENKINKISKRKNLIESESENNFKNHKSFRNYNQDNSVELNKQHENNKNSNNHNAFDYKNYSPFTYKNDQNTPSSTNKLNDTSNLNLKDNNNFEKMKILGLEDKEKIESINTRNTKLRDFLKEIKTENKNIGQKNLNDYDAKREFEDIKSQQTDLPKLNKFKNEINSLQKNIEYIEKKLLENGNNTFSSPLSTLNNQYEDSKNNFNNGFSYKTINANSLNYDNYPLYENKNENEKKTFNKFSDKYKNDYNSNPFIQEPSKYEKNNYDYSKKYSFKDNSDQKINNESVEMPLKKNPDNEYKIQETKYKDFYNENNKFNYEVNSEPAKFQKFENLSEKYKHSNTAVYEKNNHRYISNYNTLDDNYSNNQTDKNNATTPSAYINNEEGNREKNDYNLDKTNKSKLGSGSHLYSETGKTITDLKSNNDYFFNYKTINPNNETNVYNKKYNSPELIIYADSSKPVFESNKGNENTNISNINKHTSTYERTFNKNNNKAHDNLEMQKEISLREEDIRLLNLEIKRLNQENEQYYSSLEQEKDKNKGYLVEIENLGQIKDDLKVLNQKYDFLTNEYRDIVIKLDKSEKTRKEQENLISSLQREIESQQGQKSKKHSRNPSRVNTNHHNKSEIKQEDENRDFINTEDYENEQVEEEKGSFVDKALKNKEPKNSEKKKSKSKNKKKADNDSKKSNSVLNTNYLKRITNNNSNTSNISSLSSNINKEKLKQQKSLSKGNIKRGTSKKSENDISTITKKTSKSKYNN